MSETAQALQRILAKVKGDPELFTRLPDTADLVSEVGLDSLELLQFMLEIEATLSVQIDFDKLDYAYLRDVHTLAAFLDAMPPRATTSVA